MNMKTFVATAFCGGLVMMTPALAQTDPPPPPPLKCIQDGGTERCDNGWGNGPDGTNAGSLSGGTAPSKSSNGGDRSDAHYPDALDRFDGR